MNEYLDHEGANAPKSSPGTSTPSAARWTLWASTSIRRHTCEPTSRRWGLRWSRRPTSYPHMASPWLTIGPECIYWGVRNVCDVWKAPAIYITENGCSSDDVVNAPGRIEDIDRVMYLRNHLTSNT